MITLNATKPTATYPFLGLAIYVFPCRVTSYSLYEEGTRLFMIFGVIKGVYCMQGLPADNFSLAHASSVFYPNFK
jgi:uncharacterized membrane protein